MGLINKLYTFANGTGNNVDATQINADFDTLYTAINGNIEAANIKNETITLAKLASAVKVIENVYHTPLTSNYNFTTSEATMITQNINLSAQRYCLIIFNGYFDAISYPVIFNIYDGTTLIGAQNFLSSADYRKTITIVTYKQLASGAHTIYVKGYQNGGTGGYLFGSVAETATRLITVAFGF